jgi:hypothetical protein
MNKQNIVEQIEKQIIKIFPNQEKTENENGDVFDKTENENGIIIYKIDDKTRLYIFEQPDNIITIGIELGFQSTPHLIDKHKRDKDFYVNFQFQNDSLKTPWSSKLGKKVNLNSLEEIVLFLKKDWDDYNNLSKN